MEFLEGIVLVANSLLLGFSVLLFIEVVVGVLSRCRDNCAGRTRDPSFAVLMPAHNEAAVIAQTVERVVRDLPHNGRLLVVADNCSDDTASIARATGADVVVRNDPTRRGKGYALDYGVRYLAQDPPDVVIVLDADCVPDAGALETLAEACAGSGRPLQAHYVMNVPAGGGNANYLKLAAFAWRLKTWLRPRGLAAMGLPCQLMGTGMAFPWSLAPGLPLATGHLVEDLVLGLHLAEDGHPAYFYPNARVTSAFPISADGQQSQRNRWEAGHLSVIVRDVPRYLGTALWRRDVRLAALALDAAVPPLALLALLCSGSVLLSALWAIFSGSLLPLAVAASTAALFAVSVFVAWRSMGRDLVTFRELALVLPYIARKLVIYSGLIAGRSVEWVRTKRT
jgi:cellulose synthase/poly-beta-1,6-N-acetylglucosamine synthase-like glycosyltransferase